ncbi:MAG TPA: sulfatase [Candidatus Binatia bacterium]|nr:sulfatase [Candidatus Binatia bacterium]
MGRHAIGAIVFYITSLAVAAYGAVALPAGKAHPAANERPNFIVINTDDLDSKSVELLPKIKALLADHGTVFSNNFVTYSLCCPSRSSLLRGQYPHNHQIFSNFYPEGGFQRFHELGNEQSTVATWLKSAGYRTMLAGKYLNGYPGKLTPAYVPPGWDEWYALIGHHYAYYDYHLSENGRDVAYGDTPKDYETDVLAAKTIDFIARAGSNHNQPFFIYLAPSAPHLPATPAPKYASAFPNATAPRPESFNADVKGRPAWIHNKKPLTSGEISEIDQMYRKRLQSMLSVDDMVAEIVQELEKHGRLHNTYIFFTSDNGFHLGEHRLREGKSTAYEEDIRVPLIVRGPGVAAHRVASEMSLNIDLAPTLADLAGVAMPDFVDGRSLKPLLHGTPLSAPWRHDFFVQYRTKTHRNLPSFDGLRSTEYLYVEYATGEKELYDVRADPYEMHNLARTSSPELLAELSKRVSDLKRCAGAGCRRDLTDPLL